MAVGISNCIIPAEREIFQNADVTLHTATASTIVNVSPHEKISSQSGFMNPNEEEISQRVSTLLTNFQVSQKSNERSTMKYFPRNY